MAGPDRNVLGYRFATFEVDLRAGELRKNGMKIKLQDQPFRLLAILLEHPGEAVLREELQQRLWPADTFVDFDHSLNTAVTRIREALGDSADNPRFVQTLPRRGYRFLASLEAIEDKPSAEPPSPISQPPTPAPAPSPISQLPTPASAPVRRYAAWRVWTWRALFAVLAAVAVYGYFSGWRIWQPRGTAAPELIRLVVLPFVNLSGDPSQEYFGDGMTEEMITQLGRVNPQRLAVIARTSAMRYKDTKTGVQQVASDLKVTYVVEGSFRRVGNNVRITAKLIQVSDQTQLWNHDYDVQVADVLQIQSQVAQSVAGQISVQLLPYRPPRPVKPEAYEAALLGRYYWNRRTDADLQKAAESLQAAVTKDPSYALAQAWMAEVYHLLGYYSVLAPVDAYPKARAAAQRALQLDETLGEAHATLADVTYLYENDWKGAEKEFRKAIELSPNSATAHQWYGAFLTLQGRFPEGRAEIEKAHALDLLSPVINAEVGLACYYRREYPQAVEQYRKSIELDPHFSQTHAWLGMALLQLGRTAEALEEFRQGVTLSKGSQGTVALEAYALARAGRRQEAVDRVHQLEAAARQRYVSPLYISLVYVALGDKDQAFQWAEKGFRDRSGLLARMRREPLLDPVRDDPRFANLMARVGAK